MVDRLGTVSITCWVSNVGHEVTERDVAAAGRHGQLCYWAICGCRFTDVLRAPLETSITPLPRFYNK